MVAGRDSGFPGRSFDPPIDQCVAQMCKELDEWRGKTAYSTVAWIGAFSVHSVQMVRPLIPGNGSWDLSQESVLDDASDVAGDSLSVLRHGGESYRN